MSLSQPKATPVKASSQPKVDFTQFYNDELYLLSLLTNVFIDREIHDILLDFLRAGASHSSIINLLRAIHNERSKIN